MSLLRALMRYLMNNEQLIQKLADSYPMRRAAQLTASLYHKGKEFGEENLEKLRESEAVKRLQNEAQHSASKVKGRTDQSLERGTSVLQAFLANLEDEWKKGKNELDAKQKKELEARQEKEDAEIERRSSRRRRREEKE